MVTSPRPRQQAFTLIELLVVITIIAVLAGMLLPAVGLVRDQAQRARCAANHRQVTMAIEVYCGDNESLYPPVVWNESYWTWGYDPGQGRWQHLLDSYLGTYRVLNCPTAATAVPALAIRDTASPGPRGTAPAGNVCLYAYNKQYWGRQSTSASQPGPMTRSKVEALLRQDVPGADVNRCPLLICGTWAFAAPAYDGNFSVNNWGVYFPHRLRQNTSFADGHVESHVIGDFSFAGNGVLVP